MTLPNELADTSHGCVQQGGNLIKIFPKTLIFSKLQNSPSHLRVYVAHGYPFPGTDLRVVGIGGFPQAGLPPEGSVRWGQKRERGAVSSPLSWRESFACLGIRR